MTGRLLMPSIYFGDMACLLRAL